MRLCSTLNLDDENQIQRVMSYTGSIIEFLRNFTKKAYNLDKIG